MGRSDSNERSGEQLWNGEVLNLLGIEEEVHPLRCLASTGLGAVGVEFELY
jgi:hypothetical protein